MFFIGGLPALLAIYVRLHVRESEVWEKTRHTEWAHLGRAIISNWRLFLYLFLMMTMMNFVSHGTQDMYPTFLKEQRGFNERTVSYIAIVYNVGAILGGLVVGWYSDRVGRRRAMVTALLLAIGAIPLWAYAPTTGLLVAGAFALQFMVQGAWGVVPAHINELSPDSVRGFLPGFAYQCGVAVAGTVAYIEAVFAARFSYASAMALTALTVFTLAAIVVSLGSERHAHEFGIVAQSRG
jgi:SHS family lactate transporter-like MFS transporter